MSAAFCCLLETFVSLQTLPGLKRCMPWYIQRKSKGQPLETVDEFVWRSHAVRALAEYQLSDREALYYISTVPCRAWKNRA
jgi:hypothetical protein